jgi:tetratricopeptide (TPR) repeat protein
MMDRYGKALPDLNKPLEIDQNNAFALNSRGEVYFMIDKYEEALADLNKLLEIIHLDYNVLKKLENIRNEQIYVTTTTTQIGTWMMLNIGVVTFISAALKKNA